MLQVRTRTLVALALVLTFAVTVATACGGGNDNSSSTGVTPTASSTTGGAKIQAPSNVAGSGELVFCSDITYPPEEFYKSGTTTPQGSDIDIGNGLAKLMGVKARFDNTGFDGIIAALQAKKCDAIISGMNDTPERRKQVAFVDYISVGQSFMVKKGNPENITSLATLAGKSASVETGTTNKDYLEAQSKKLTAGGKKAINVVTFPKDTDAAAALKTGKVDAYFGDSPVVAYYIAQDPSSFAFGGNPVNPIPVGIAIRTADTALQKAIRKGVAALYANGEMKRILARWKMSAFALKNPPK